MSRTRGTVPPPPPPPDPAQPPRGRRGASIRVIIDIAGLASALLEHFTMPLPPGTAQQRERASRIIEDFRAGKQSEYASIGPLAGEPGGTAILVWTKHGMDMAMGVAREIVLQLHSEFPGTRLLADPHNLQHKVWVPN